MISEFEEVPKSSLGRLFGDLVQRSFDDLQVGNPQLRGYVRDLLCRFVRTDAIFRIKDPGGRGIETVVELLIEGDRAKTMEDGVSYTIDVQRQTGDYALFMSGIFRAYVERYGYLDFYLETGPRAYRATAGLESDLGFRPGPYEILAREFEHLSGAIDYMKKVYFGVATMQGDLKEIARRFSLWN